MHGEISKNMVKYAPIVKDVLSGEASSEISNSLYPIPDLGTRELIDKKIDRGLAVSVLNLVPLGVILTDENCRLILVNRAAEKILTEHDGLKLNHDTVVATSSRESRALRKLVSDAVHSSPSGECRPCAAMTVSRTSSRRAYEIVVVGLPVKTVIHRPFTMVAVLFIGQQDVENATVEPVIAGLYGLTPAESRLAAKLMRGRSLSQISSELQITRETARTHLRNIFSKTQTNRQSELVRLLVAGPGNVCLRNEG